MLDQPTMLVRFSQMPRACRLQGARSPVMLIRQRRFPPTISGGCLAAILISERSASVRMAQPIGRTRAERLLYAACIPRKFKAGIKICQFFFSKTRRNGIFAVSSLAGRFAVVANDDLLPYLVFLRPHRPLTPMMEIYWYSRWRMDLENAEECLGETFANVDTRTLWVRASTGRLCIDLVPSELEEPYLSMHSYTLGRYIDLNHPDWQIRAVNFMKTQGFHNGIHQAVESNLTAADVGLGAVMFSPSDDVHGDPIEIAYLSASLGFTHGWYSGSERGKIVETGWTRFDSAEIFDKTAWLGWYTNDSWWLSQANHVFERLRLKAKDGNYALVAYTDFFLDISAPAAEDSPPDGYLFLAPPENFKLGPHSVQWPPCAWFWSLDPTGADGLSADQALRLGFPPAKPHEKIWTRTWDETIYEEVAKFNVRKGFDPTRPDVAIHHGHPLYQIHPAFDHGIDVDGGATVEEVKDDDEDLKGVTRDDIVVSSPILPFWTRSRNAIIEFVRFAAVLVLGMLFHAVLQNV